MYRIKTLNKISSAGLDQLDKSRFQVGNDVENEDGILVRSAAMHDYVFPDALRAIARAGAGTNNIPIDRCSENGIVVFNTPGANANAVKELVIAALLIASRDILGGAEWVQEQAHTPNVDLATAVEKGKSAFVGPELYRKTLGVIGLGAIGALVCNIALDLGMDVYGYDPFLSVDAALRLARHVHVVKNVDELYKVSDYITIHVPYTNDTKDFINAEAIAKKMEELDFFASIKRMDYDEAVEKGLITVMGAETDEKFLSNVMGQVNDKAAVEKVADTFKMVYTPFHGTGYKLIPEALKRLGMKHVICVPEQMVIDGDFPTVVSPNPENPEGFYLAVDLAKKNNADFILGSDPDADRVGIMVRTKDDDFVVISGNQTGVLLLDYLIGAKQRTGKMPEKPVALKTIVTTEMARKVAEVNGLQCYDTFTGFKFLAQKKDQLESSGEGNVIMSYEESYGYMLGDYVRDKDAVTASMLLTEMAAWYAAQGMTLFDALEKLYEKYGHYAEKTYNLVMPGLDGLKDMAQLMKNLRENPPAEISGVKVVTRKDYTDGSVVDCATGAKSAMELSGSNVLRFELADGTTILVRPSGTEPKIKVYILTQGADSAACDANLEKYGQWVKTLQK